MKKRILSMLLAIVMVCSLLPTAVFAAETHTNHCVCNGKAVETGEHTSCNNEQTWMAWDGTSDIEYDADTKTAYVHLSADAERTSKLSVADGYTLNLCLNGHSLSPADGFSGHIFDLSGTLTLTDCVGGGKITGSKSYSVYLRGGTFNMYGGAITESNNSAVEVEHNGTFNMYGGEIKNNKAYRGAGIYHHDGTIRISGGTITGNVAQDEGGAIFSQQSGIEICGNPVIAENFVNSGADGEANQINNFYAYSIDIVGPMTDGASIGMTIAHEELGYFAIDTYGSSADYSKYFFSDKGYPVYKEGDFYYFGYRITKQPSDTDYSVEVNSTNGASYQWCEVIKGAPVSVDDTYIEDNDGYVIGDYDENGWSAFVNSSVSMYFGIEMNANDELTAKFASAPQGEVILVNANTNSSVPVVSGGENTYTFITEDEGPYLLAVYAEDGPKVKATLTKNTLKEVDGQNAAALDTNGLDTGTYACQVTWDMGTADTSDDYTLTSATVTYTKPTYTVTVTANPTEGGTVIGGGTYDHGAAVTLTATPDTGYSFVNWTEGGVEVSPAAEYTFTATEDRALVANFVEVHTHCVCGGSIDVAGHTHDITNPTWKAWNGTDAIAYTDGVAYVYLSADAERTSTLTIPTGKTLNLCLNGHMLKNTASNQRVIDITGGILNLTDCGSTGTITGGSFTDTSLDEANTTGSVVRVKGDGTFHMYGGTITGNSSVYSGTVAVGYYYFAYGSSDGTFHMYGGTISNNQSRHGGGVFVRQGSFTMHDGTISGNTANVNGGGVYVQSTATFTMDGGTISGNTANVNGDSVYGSLKISGSPKISGDVYLGSSGKITITGALNLPEGYKTIQVYSSKNEQHAPITVGASEYGVITDGEQSIFVPKDTENTRIHVHNGEVCQKGKPTVTFDANGGGPTPDKQTLPFEGGKATAPAEDPTRNGYVFSHWCGDEDCTDYNACSGWNFDTVITESKTIYAIWEPITVTITSEPGKLTAVTSHVATAYQWSTLSDADYPLNEEEIRIGTRYYAPTLYVDGWLEDGCWMPNDVDWDSRFNVFYFNIYPDSWNNNSSIPAGVLTVTLNDALPDGCVLKLMPYEGETVIEPISVSGNTYKWEMEENGDYYLAVQRPDGVAVEDMPSVKAVFTVPNSALNPIDGETNAIFTNGENGKEYKVTATFEGGSEITSASEVFEELTVYTVTANPTEGGTVIGGGTYDHGAAVTLTATPDTGYSFVNWTESGTEVSTEATYTFTASADRNLVANFEKNSYTITWKNEDGSVIDTTTVEYGTVPTHANPTKAADAQYTYTFAGWTPEVVAVTGEATYTATYTETVNKYTVTFYDEDGTTVLETATWAYGSVPSFTKPTPAKAADAENTYAFKEWVAMSGLDSDGKVTGDASFKASYTATKIDYTGTVSPEEGTMDNVTADGLGEVAEEINRNIVLTVKVEAADANDTEQTAIKGQAGNRTLAFLDITLKDDGGNSVEVPQSTVLEIAIPFTVGNKRNITVYRHHNGTAAAFTALNTTPAADARTDATFYVDSANNCIYVYTNQFSTYAIGYTVPYYPPIYGVVVENAVNGTVKTEPNYAASGSTVTVTVTPDKGYVLDKLTVIDILGREVDVAVKDGEYTFKMPEAKVAVKATFKEEVAFQNPFEDVFATDYYYDAVLWAVKEGITNGTSATTFSPNAPCTRAQMVTFLWRAAGSPEPTATTCPLTDVDVDSYYGKAVLWAVENGITKGTSDTTFSPDMECSRAQMATFLCRMAGGKAESDTIAFTDVKADAYYAESVQWAVENGITNGTGDNKFSPDATCTRAQMVTFLYRYYN